MKKAYCLLPIAFSLSACVGNGYEGQTGAIISSDQIIARREANRTISVHEIKPAGHRSIGEVSVRRCHRNFVEEAPTIEAITNDLKIAAYAQGADAISNIQTQKLNGLLANCWYVLEGTAQIWQE